MIFAQPVDGWTQIERLLMRQFIIKIYSMIPDPIDKFILIARHESDYKQDEISEMIGISQVAVSKRLTKVKKVMRKKRKQNKL